MIAATESSASAWSGGTNGCTARASRGGRVRELRRTPVARCGEPHPRCGGPRYAARTAPPQPSPRLGRGGEGQDPAQPCPAIPSRLTRAECLAVAAGGGRSRRTGWLGLVFGVVGLALIPWTLYLAATLPGPARAARLRGDLGRLRRRPGRAARRDGLRPRAGQAVGAGRRGGRGGAARLRRLVRRARLRPRRRARGRDRARSLAELPTALLCIAIARRAEVAAYRAQAFVQIAMRRRAALEGTRLDRSVEPAEPSPAVSRR